jgi:hypothetical protein
MTQIEQLLIGRLKFDPQNPRLPRDVRGRPEAEIITYMAVNENLFDLIASIAEQGFFPGEPLLVVQDQADLDNFIVVEGNRRLAALKVLNDPSLVTRKRIALADILNDQKADTPLSAPVLKYPNRESLLDYLGYRHVTGVDQWDSLAKARYLTQLQDLHKDEYLSAEDGYRHLAKTIGSRKDYVQKLIEGYSLYEHIESNDFYDIEGLNEKEFKFSLLTTAVSYTNISEYLKLSANDGDVTFDETILKELTSFLFELTSKGSAKIPDSRNLKEFSNVVASPMALDAFREGHTLAEAEIFTDGPFEALKLLIDKSHETLMSAQATSNKVREISQPISIYFERLNEIFTIAEGLQSSLTKSVERGKKAMEGGPL